MPREYLELSPGFAAKLSGPVTFERFLNLEGRVFRAVARRRTLRFEAGGSGYFIKIHLGAGWGEIFKNLLQARLPVVGATNEWRAIKRLTQLRVDTMTPAGFGCRGWNPATRQSFVITEELAGTVNLEDFTRDWRSLPPGPRLKRALIRKIAEAARTLHENGVNHRDFYICHFHLDPLRRDYESMPLYLIDLHRVQIRRNTPRRWRIKDIAGIYFSSMDHGLTRCDLLRFMRVYRRKSLREILCGDERFWRRVEKKARALYRSHMEKYRLYQVAGR